jgi:hypothetical protein
VNETSAGGPDAVPAPAGSAEPEAPPVNSGFISKDTETIHDRQEDSDNLSKIQEDDEEVDVAYTYVSHLDPRRQADPHGVYLDDVQRRDAEAVRARIEDRDPDFDNPPATVSTPLVPTVQAQHLAPTGAAVPVDHVETVSVGGDNPDTNAAVVVPSDEDDE